MAAVLAVLAVGTAVFALSYTTPFSSGDPLSSAKVNSYLQDLDSRINAMKPATWTWVAPALLNNWTQQNPSQKPVGYYKDPFGVVHLRGIVINANAQSAASVFFNLPAGNQPSTDSRFLQWSYSPVAVDINGISTPRGDVFLPAAIAANTPVELDGISFHAE